MVESKICFVQFQHPGQEHGGARLIGNIKEWNKGEHKRKFLLSSGKFLDEKGKPQTGPLCFWGEWEPQSKVDKLLPKEDGYPKYLHEPLIRPVSAQKISGSSFANTDPNIFGDQFKYLNCQQKNGNQLARLEKGSVIVFGSNLGKHFVADTIFVVGDFVEYKRGNYNQIKKLTTETYYHAAIKPLMTKKDCTDSNCGGGGGGNKPEDTLRFYLGATFENPFEGMYSFVPCKQYSEKSNGFKRADLSSHKLITTTQKQGYKIETYNSAFEVFGVWNEIRQIVKKQGLLEGVGFVEPSATPSSIILS